MIKTRTLVTLAALTFSTIALPLSSHAEDTAEVTLTLTGTTFEPAEIKATSGKPLIIKFKNANAKPAEFESNDLNLEKIAAANSEIVLRINELPKGKFLFVDEFQEDVAKGYIIGE